MSMKNFRSSSTMIGQIPEGLEFEKAKDYVGEYEKGVFVVLGYLKTHSKKYNNDNYSLFCLLNNEHKLLNVPGWYGKKLEEDFLKEGGDPEKYFDSAYIKTISPLETDKGESVSIEIYEE